MSMPHTDIDALHGAIKAALSSQFPDARVEFYDRPGASIQTPAILLEIEDIHAQDPDDIGTEQLGATINLNAYCVLDYKTSKKQQVKTFAAALMAFLHGKKWGQPVARANVVGAYPDIIAGHGYDYEVMRVEFSHDVLLGDDFWKSDNLTDDEGEPIPPPSEVYSNGEKI